MAACTSSNGLTNVYLFSLSYKAPTTDASADPFLLNYGVVDSLSDQLSRSNNTLQEIRVGYLGMCLALQSGVWICGGSPDAMITELKALDIQDPLNIFRLAQHVRSEILFYPLM